MRRLEPCHCFQALSVGDCEMWLNHVLQKQVQQITLAIQSAESFSVGWSSLWLLNLKEDLPNISVQSCSRCVRVNNQRPLVPVFIDSWGWTRSRQTTCSSKKSRCLLSSGVVYENQKHSSNLEKESNHLRMSFSTAPSQIIFRLCNGDLFLFRAEHTARTLASSPNDQIQRIRRLRSSYSKFMFPRIIYRVGDPFWPLWLSKEDSPNISVQFYLLIFQPTHVLEKKC